MRQKSFQVLVAALVIHLSTAFAIDFLLEIPGIPGESNLSGRKGYITVDSFSFGISNSSAIGTGGGGVITAGKVNFSEISFSKQIDISVPLLMSQCTSGTPLSKVTLIGQRTQAGNNALVFYELTLENVLVTSVQSTGASNLAGQVSFSLDFAKMTLVYRPFLPTGELGDRVQFSFDRTKLENQ